MKIDKSVLIGREDSVGKKKDQLSEIFSQVSPSSLKYEKLVHISEKYWDWDEVKITLKEKPELVDSLLFRLHFKRSHVFSENVKNRILLFLTIGYHITRDVRYFNEFIWFNGDDNSSLLWFVCLDCFFCNIDKNNHHYFSISTTKEMREFLDSATELVEEMQINKSTDITMRIGLLGVPLHFSKLQAQLVKYGFHVNCYFIPYHRNKLLNSIIKSKFVYTSLKLVESYIGKFKKPEFDRNDKKITAILQNDSLDIGFHRLGFIIKNNIINGFKIGLINDHWALLPYFRGRSTIEFSLLHGAPLVATTHLVTEEIDKGGILMLFPYVDSMKKCSSVKEIRELIRSSRRYRMVESIKLLSKTKSETLKNANSKGATFYTIHPILLEFINDRVLKTIK